MAGWDLGGLFGMGDLAASTGSQWGSMFDGMGDSLFGSQSSLTTDQMGQWGDNISQMDDAGQISMGNYFTENPSVLNGTGETGLFGGAGEYFNPTTKQGNNMFGGLMGAGKFGLQLNQMNRQNEYMSNANKRANTAADQNTTMFNDAQAQNARKRSYDYRRNPAATAVV